MLAVKAEGLLVLAVLAVLALAVAVVVELFQHQVILVPPASAPALVVVLDFMVRVLVERQALVFKGLEAVEAALAVETEVVSVIASASVAALTVAAICFGATPHLEQTEMRPAKEPFVSFGVLVALVELPHSHQPMLALNFLEKS